jgi:hypothetical protein
MIVAVTDVLMRTATDFVHLLLERCCAQAPRNTVCIPLQASQIRAKAEKAVKVSYCSRRLSWYEAADIAIAALFSACEQLDLGEEFLELFVPRFMMTAAARECFEKLNSTVATVQGACALIPVRHLHSSVAL